METNASSGKSGLKGMDTPEGAGVQSGRCMSRAFSRDAAARASMLGRFGDPVAGGVA